MFIAEELIQFKKLFVSKLKAMLTDDELGAFILVLANSRQDEFLKNALAGDLTSAFEKLKESFLAGSLQATQDDSNVFEQLLKLEAEGIPPWKKKSIGEWDVSYNAMRQLRPARASSQKLSTIKQDFDEDKFHFNKSFLKPEILWEGIHKNLKLRVLYNKFPFSDYHLLIVVSPERKYSQLLTQDVHKYVFSLAKEIAKIFPGFGIGFNSLAAGASVNHLHFQGFLRKQNFAIEKSHWKHNGGDTVYPLEVKRFDDADSSWEYMNKLIENDAAFNSVYRSDTCYVVPRKYQGAVELPGWLEGAGWLDVAGVMTVSDEETFDTLDERTVTHALSLMQ